VWLLEVELLLELRLECSFCLVVGVVGVGIVVFFCWYRWSLVGFEVGVVIVGWSCCMLVINNQDES